MRWIGRRAEEQDEEGRGRGCGLVDKFRSGDGAFPRRQTFALFGRSIRRLSDDMTPSFSDPPGLRRPIADGGLRIGLMGAPGAWHAGPPSNSNTAMRWLHV